MAMNEDFDGDPGGGFSHLLESGSGGDQELGFDLGGGDQSFMYSSSFPSLKPPTMLCFSNVCSKNEREVVGGGEKFMINKQKCSESSSTSSSNNSSCTKRKNSIDGGGEVMKTEDERRKNGSGQEFDIGVPVMGFSSGNKKPKKEKPAISSTTRPVKVRKEKLGERITALQQLVSPFGKTDTASVLHEAMGYIRFLHDQVQVLSSPYLQNMPSSSAQGGGGRGDDDEKVMMVKKSSSTSCYDYDYDDLRSRGLCLVPVEYTVHVADCNGADLWSPAAAMGRTSTTRPTNNNNSSTTTTTFNH